MFIYTYHKKSCKEELVYFLIKHGAVLQDSWDKSHDGTLCARVN